MSEPNGRSFAEVWSSAQDGRARYCRVLLRRAYRAGKAWLRRLVAGVALQSRRGALVSRRRACDV
jgi:hypothetical protein